MSILEMEVVSHSNEDIVRTIVSRLVFDPVVKIISAIPCIVCGKLFIINKRLIVTQRIVVET